MVEPVTLEVYRDTRLLFWVERDNSSKHTFYGKLVTTTGGVVANQPIKAYINDTQISESLTTNASGFFSFERNFDPTNQKVTYVLKVVFEGTSAKTAVLNGTDFEGKPYAVCQTTQFNYKPSANMTTVVVEPQATQVTVPTKTPEQLQQEAEDSGKLKKPGLEPTWFPPFLWYHTYATIGENAWVHIAFSPLIPWWPGTVELHGAETLLTPLPSAPQPPTPPPPSQPEVSQVLRTIVTKTVAGLVGLAVAAVAGANLRFWPSTVGAMFIYSGFAAYLLTDAFSTFYSSEWGAHTKGMAKMAGLLVTFLLSAFAVELSLRSSLFFKCTLIPILSTFFSNLISSGDLTTAIDCTTSALIIGLGIGLEALKIPDPSLTNQFFRPAFLVANVALSIAAIGSILAMLAMS